MKNLTINQLNEFQTDYLKDPVQRAVRRALYQAPLFQVASSQENEANMQHHFSIDIKTMDATSQGASGRCWIFAGMNVLREIVAKKLNLEQFELSQNYVAFYDKLEKINFLGTVNQWAEIDFRGAIDTPTYFAGDLYINGELLTKANITATKINDWAFTGCKSLTSVTISATRSS